MRRNKREIINGTVFSVKTDKKMLKKLEPILEIRVLDLKGKLIMTFWKGEKHQ